MLYSWLSMVMRACLVGLDWNDSIDRRHKALETGWRADVQGKDIV